MTRTLRIDPDGSVSLGVLAPLEAGNVEFGGHSTVITCAAPFLPDGVWIGVIDDFGAQDSDLNRKAWALYGRSPLYGPVFFGSDTVDDVPDDLIQLLTAPLDQWPLPSGASEIVRLSSPERPSMLTDRPVAVMVVRMGGGVELVRQTLAALPGDHLPEHVDGDVYRVATSDAGFLRFALETQGYGQVISEP